MQLTKENEKCDFHMQLTKENLFELKTFREIWQSENVTCFEQTKTNCCHRGTIDYSFPA